MSKATRDVEVSREDYDELKETKAGEKGYMVVENIDGGQRATFVTPNGKEYAAEFEGGIKSDEPIEVEFTESDKAKPADWVVTVVHNEKTGEQRMITGGEMMEAISGASQNRLDEIMSEWLTEDYESYGGGLVGFDFHPNMEYVQNGSVPFAGVEGFDGAGLRPGQYFGLYNVLESGAFNERDLMRIRETRSDGLLLASDAALVDGEGVTLVPVTVSPRDEQGGEYPDAPYNFITAWLIQSDETGAYATVYDLLGAVFIGATFQIIVAGDDTLRKWWGIEGDKGPLMIRNGKLFTEGMRGKPKKADVWPTDVGFTVEMGGQLSISSDDAKALDTAIGGNKTLIQLNALATASGYKYGPDKPCRVETTLDEIIEQRGGNPKNKKTRSKVTRELKAISSIAWNFKNNEGEWARIPLAGGMCSVKRGKVSFVFSAEYMGAVLDRAAGRLPLDRLLLATDDKNNPNATPIGFKLCTHTYQNKGKKNEGTLSVSRLLEYVNSIPSYEEVASTDRLYTRRIIRPLERDLNHLQEIGFLDWWDYCHANGEPLTDAEQAARFDDDGNDAPLPYDMAIACNIQWQLSEEYAEQMAETMEARERKRVDAEAAKQRNAERSKRMERRKETYIAKAAAKKETGEQ